MLLVNSILRILISGKKNSPTNSGALSFHTNKYTVATYNGWSIFNSLISKVDGIFYTLSKKDLFQLNTFLPLLLTDQSICIDNYLYHVFMFYRLIENDFF